MLLERCTDPPCPNCGCQQAHRVATSSRWGATNVRFRCGNRRCRMEWSVPLVQLQAAAAEEEAAHNEREKAAAAEEEARLMAAHSNGVKAVIYRPLRCPECGSKSVRVASTRRKATDENPQLRRMKCQECGAAFKSIEAD